MWWKHWGDADWLIGRETEIEWRAQIDTMTKTDSRWEKGKCACVRVHVHVRVLRAAALFFFSWCSIFRSPFTQQNLSLALGFQSCFFFLPFLPFVWCPGVLQFCLAATHTAAQTQKPWHNCLSGGGRGLIAHVESYRWRGRGSKRGQSLGPVPESAEV